MSAIPKINDDCRILSDLAASLFDTETRVGVARISDCDPRTLFESEVRGIRNAVASRAREFAAGRTAARQALGQSVAIDTALDRTPLWPNGVAGSITHAAGFAVAAVSRRASMVGLDLEPHEDLPEEIIETVLSPSERTRVGDLREARLVFSLKECAYKAQFPLTRQIFGFDGFEVAWSSGKFEAEFRQPVGDFDKGHVLAGRYGIDGGFILSGISA